jgi:hypothetical protein
MVRPVPNDCSCARRDCRRDGRQGQDRQAERRREPEDRVEIRCDVDPDADDFQGRRDGFPPGWRRAQSEASAVDHRCGLILAKLDDFKRPAKAGRFTMSAVEAPFVKRLLVYPNGKNTMQLMVVVKALALQAPPRNVGLLGGGLYK